MELLEQGERLFRLVELVGVNLLGGLAVILPVVWHRDALLVACAQVTSGRTNNMVRRPGPSRRYSVGRALADGDAHRAGGAGDDLFGGLDGVGVEVLHL